MVFLEVLCSALNQAKANYAVVGGHAVALHGAVRGTLDIDIALKWTRSDLLKTERTLNEIGLQSTLPLKASEVYEFRDEYVRNRNLIAWNFHNPDNPAEQVDIIINFDARSKKTVTKTVGNTAVKVLGISDLIMMKQASGRDQDNEDVKALEELI